MLTTPPRDTGIDVLGEMPWGSHICVFYETKKDLIETDIAYLSAGLRANESCLWVLGGRVSTSEAMAAFRASAPEFDRHLATGQVEVLDGRDWYFENAQLDPERIIRGWKAKCRHALGNGFEGLRVSGTPFQKWFTKASHWKAFCEYEQQLDRELIGRKIIVLCTFSLETASAADVLDVLRSHQCTVARRNGAWESIESAELARLQSFPDDPLLTPRERMVLARIREGASSKEIARSMGISPRTVEFHRSNTIKKLSAKNTADLVRKSFERWPGRIP